MLIVTIYDVDVEGHVEDRFRVFFKDGPDGDCIDVTEQYEVAACQVEGTERTGFMVAVRPEVAEELSSG